jgi:hypothetical protein
MLVLFDNSTPRGIAREPLGHTIKESREQGWDTLRTGGLLDAAEAAGFDLLVTTGQNIRYQQNLTGRKIAIVVIGKGRWRLIRPLLPQIVAAVNAATPGSYTEVDIPDFR